MAWYTFNEVTINNGDTSVVVTSNEAINSINDHDGFIIDPYNAVDINRAYTETESPFRKIIELVTPWPNPNQINTPCRIQPTPVYVDEAIQAVNDLKEKVVANWTPLLAYGNQPTGTVTFAAADSAGQDVTVRTLGQMNSDILALEQSATDSVADLNAVDAAINDPGGLNDQVTALGTTLSTIDSTLSGYATTASTAANNAATSETNAATSETNAAMSESNAAASESNAVTSASNAATSESNAAASADAAAVSAANAASFEGGNASSLVSIAGANFYNSVNNVPTKTTVGLSNVDNTSDADKPISTATQTALNSKTDTGHTHSKSEVGLSNVDNTSDVDKPISTAVQAQLDKIRKLALAGL
jgi:hypothetical protein